MQIRQIETTDREYQDFLRLPERIYQDIPNHRPRPEQETHVLLDRSENPCWKHACRALFLLEKDGEVIGRIVAIHDKELDRQHHKSEGFFGFFECINDMSATKSLLQAAADWLVGQGCHTMMRGPCNPLPDFYSFGIQVEGFDQPQVTGEAFSPPYYQTLMEGCGLVKDSDYLSYRIIFEGNAVFEKMMQRLEGVLIKHKHGQGHLHIRSFDVENFHRDAAIVHDIINRSFESESFYSQVDLGTQEFMLRNTSPLQEMWRFLFVEEDGVPVGVSLTAPNVDELLWGETITMSRAENFAVLPEYQRTFAASSLFYHAWIQILRSGFKENFISYVAEENEAMQRISKSFGCECSKRFRVYRRKL